MTAETETPAVGIRRFVKDPFPGISHGGGAVLAVGGLALLLTVARPEPSIIAGVIVYGLSLILLYAASCVAHSVHVSPRVDDLLDRLDYAAIFMLIAGTYTPICLTTLTGTLGRTILVVEWALAVVGAVMVLLVGPRKIWVGLYLPMGWLVFAAVGPLLRLMETFSLVCLLIGGIIYSVGAIVFVTRRPVLWPGVFDHHDLWHVLVLTASAFHFVAIYRLVS